MRTSRYSRSTISALPLPGFEEFTEAWQQHRSREGEPGHRARPGEANVLALSGVVRIAHLGADYSARYELRGELLTVYCGLASNTGLLLSGSPSPKPLAERLLRELVDAEHPGLNPA